MESPLPSYAALESVEQLSALVDKVIADGLPFAYDIESGYEGPDKPGASLHPEEAFVVGFSFTNSVDWARYVPLAHDIGQNIEPIDAAPHLWRLLQTGLGVAHNVKFELRHLAKFFRSYLGQEHMGCPMEQFTGYFPFRSDTMIEAYLLAEWESKGLKQLTKAIYNYDQAPLDSLFPKKLTAAQGKSIRFNVLDLTPQVISYACEDSTTCLALHLRHFERVKAEYGFLFKVELAIVPILCDMEDYGVRYDWPAMATRAADVDGFLTELRVEIMADLSATLGRAMDVNLGSPKQLSEVLFGDLGLKTSRMTKGSRDSDDPKMSTDAVALEALSKKYPVVRKILDWKEIKKLLGSYLEKYERDFAYAADGRTHPSHMQTGVPSGRFAVADPPYQQTPKKYHYELASGRLLDFNFRNFILASSGNYLLGFDYSQVELRVMAGASQEPALLKAFNEGVDVHTQTAALMFHVPIEAVTPDMRDKGKTLNFALLYGQGVKGTAEQLGISQQEAQTLYDAYFSAFTSVRRWMETTTHETVRNGFTRSKFGRKVTIWELQSEYRSIYSKGERLAVNAPIQGGAADYMKIAMVRCAASLKKEGLYDDVHLIMNIHDALYFEIPRTIPPQRVIKCLQSAITFPVEGWPKIAAEWSYGLRWGSMTELIVDDAGTVLGKKPPKNAPKVEEPAPPAPENGTSVVAGAVIGSVGSEGDSPGTQLCAQPAPAPVKLEPVEPQEPKELHVKLSDMPDSAQYARFLEEMRKRPGVNTVVIKTPEGDAGLSGTTSFTIEDGPLISMCLGGAEVVWAPGSVDTNLVMSGLEL